MVLTKKTIINIDGSRYWENTGGRLDMFESVQRYLGPSLKVTALDCYGDQHATNFALLPLY